MVLNKDWLDEFYKGLRVLQESTFPKKCPMCRKIYASLDDFVQHTDGVSASRGLLEAPASDDQSMVALFRNCSCGSTLMVECRDRRDISNRGVNARKAFGSLMAILKQAGLTTDVARLEVLNVIRGGESAVLKKLGVSLVQKN
ncbi:MAG: oxidoreductase [Verrucomicrobia bacterium]|nr:oxidoreductase [Verrucomicrobiota bacterium]